MSKTGPNSRGLMANKIKKYRFDVEIVQKELVILICIIQIHVEI